MVRFLVALSLVAPFAAIPSVEAKEVRVYSGRHYNTDRKAYKQFSKETGIKVRLIEATGISLVERLKREGKYSNADVILLVDAARINNAAEAGLLQPVPSKELQTNVPSRYRDPLNRWFGFTRRVRAIIVNPKIVDPNTIKTYSDLANPVLKGKVCLRKRKNVYNQSLVADQIILKGETAASAWVKGMVRNVSQPYFGGDVSLIRAVGQGKCGVGLVNHYYLARMQAGSSGKDDQNVTSNIKLVMPNPAHVNISAAGVANSAKNKAEAIKFIEFISSPKGSRLIADPTFEYPLNNLGTSKELKAFGTFTPDNISISALGATQKDAIKVMANAGWR
ncbi:extracellular solute-binding protein [Synechococcus sp. MU1643]|uniref:extracellular solute-binding protein n=1 Tax=Synechococcus sp. MU1643 TaxID=2508349 RepID=UPI001CF9039D|nr:extracellular solute-binding protein [Synechococcus sp. MU1643]MCB4427534.1 extracellular solute-binding protein [Synechococcus sp. MU1643]